MNSKELNFLKEIDLLKKVERQTLIHSGGRRENSAEHSWHLATAVFIMKDYVESPIKLDRALALALFHDVVEIDGGDTFVYDDLSAKAEIEEKTLERLIALLPNKSAIEIKDLWFEYEENKTIEAMYVNALDRFLPIYANYLNEGHSWKKHGIKKAQVEARNKEKILKGLPLLWNFVEEIMEDGLKKGYLLP